ATTPLANHKTDAPSLNATGRSASPKAQWPTPSPAPCAATNKARSRRDDLAAKQRLLVAQTAPARAQVKSRHRTQGTHAMTVRIYGIKNCSTMKKAFTWLDGAGVAYDFHDYKKAGIDADTLTRWCAEVGRDALINRRGTTWRKLT